MLIYTKQETVTVEQKAMASGISQQRLMENAGSSVAKEIRNRFDVSGLKVTVLCGNGNNGGDGFVAARRLFQEGAEVAVILIGGEPTSDAACEAYRFVKGLEIPIYDGDKNFDVCSNLLLNCDVIIDGVYGFGFHGTLAPSVARLTKLANISSAFTVSIDLPSGTECDAAICAENAVKADLTVSFIAHKPCHVLYPALTNCGQVVIADIGVPKDAYTQPIMQVITEADVKAMLPNRQPDGHKGTFGTLHTVCGSYGMCGAAEFAAKAAMKSGVGLVKMSVSDSVYRILAARLPEPVYHICTEQGRDSLDVCDFRSILKEAQKADCILFGCGCGNSNVVGGLLQNIVDSVNVPIILDADGINALSKNIDILRNAKSDVVLTPHYGEMARLCGLSVAEVMCDRLGLGKKLADRYGVTLVLKGANTLIFSPDGRIYVNLTGNNGMATAGSGDMLAGIIAGLACQGVPSNEAAVAGVYLHALSGDITADHKTAFSMTVSDMLSNLHLAFAKLTRGDD